MTTPIPRILLALDGKVEFANRSNPFGPGDTGTGEGAAGEVMAGAENVAEKLKAHFGGLARKTT